MSFLTAQTLNTVVEEEQVAQNLRVQVV